MKSADKIQLQGNTVYVNGIAFAKVEKYKGAIDRLRLWLSGTAADFTILDNNIDAVTKFVHARRAATKK